MEAWQSPGSTEVGVIAIGIPCFWVLSSRIDYGHKPANTPPQGIFFFVWRDAEIMGVAREVDFMKTSVHQARPLLILVHLCESFVGFFE